MKVDQASGGVSHKVETNLVVDRDKRLKPEKDRLAEACQEFEALFWQQILRQMRRSIPKGGLLDGGTAEEIFRDFLDEEYSRTMANMGPGSLARMLYEELEKGD
jgi:flagellar protein FlgJ